MLLAFLDLDVQVMLRHFHREAPSDLQRLLVGTLLYVYNVIVLDLLLIVPSI